MNEVICETENLTKKYGNFYALKDVNLSIPKGAIYGLVGENGAGKSTLMRILTALAYPTKGEVQLFGARKHLDRERQKIGCIIETPALYQDMTARQNLEVQRIQRGIPRKESIDQVLEMVGLLDIDPKRVAAFSLGMKQRLALAIALLGEPELLILDEPINGLDPTGVMEFRILLKKLAKEKQLTILISSHILSELHQLVTHYGFLHKGKLLEQITAKELDEKCKHYICIRTENTERAIFILENQLKIQKYNVYPDTSIRIFEKLENIRDISKVLSENQIILEEISVQGENLESYFKKLIGGKAYV